MFEAAALVDAAMADTGLGDFGDTTGADFGVGLDRLVTALTTEARLTPLGQDILGHRLSTLLRNRLRIEDVYRHHPEIDDEIVAGPLFIIGLPRTGTTALSQMLSLDPQIRSLRLWESSDPVPPPETATEHTDARIAETEQGLAAMYETFPRMVSLHYQTATGPTECQDLLGMTFRTSHFDGMAYVPSYTAWVTDCDMTGAYRYHRRVLRLLQWRCPPRLWHLKTPVHMLALDALDAAYPDARFLWTHRHPAEVLGSVCSLVGYTRSWVSDYADPAELGAQQLALWSESLRRAVAFRGAVGEDRFADISFSALNADPLATVDASYRRFGLTLSAEAAARLGDWAAANPRGSGGSHEYDLSDFALDPATVADRFAFYTDAFPALVADAAPGA